MIQLILDENENSRIRSDAYNLLFDSFEFDEELKKIAILMLDDSSLQTYAISSLDKHPEILLEQKSKIVSLCNEAENFSNSISSLRSVLRYKFSQSDSK